jgi:excisionase family DNA binding protein
MQHGRRQRDGAIQTPEAADGVEPMAIPFAQRLSCTIAQACEVTGLGRTMLYELIGDGRLITTTVGRRRLVLVRSLMSMLESRSLEADGLNRRITG